ncbi:MAG: DnaJ domain-containing protein [Oceanicaulis sp.]
MSLLFAVIAVLGALAAIGWAFSQAKTETAAQGVRMVLGLGGLILGVLLTVRGFAVIGGPMIAAALGFLGVAARKAAGAGTRSGAEHDRTGGGGRSRSARMSRKEAAAVLGVSETADEAEVRRAYREMMKKVHPDAGGSDALAARVQEARDVLLGR